MKLPILILFVAIFGLASRLCADQSGDFTYTVTSNGTASISGYTGAGGAITIPSTLNGLTVTGIGAEAIFNNRTLTSVVIPSGVTSIGSCPFRWCGRLTSIQVDAANPTYSSPNGMLCNRAKTTLIQFPSAKSGNYAIANSITNISPSAFISCTNLTSVTIPSSVTSIGSSAFSDCTSLTSALFIGNAPTLGTEVFSYTASGFTVYYIQGTTGFTSPTWQGYPSVEIVPGSLNAWRLANFGTIENTGPAADGTVTLTIRHRPSARDTTAFG